MVKKIWANLNWVLNIQVPLGVLAFSWIIMLISIWQVSNLSFKMGEISGLIKAITIQMDKTLDELMKDTTSR